MHEVTQHAQQYNGNILLFVIWIRIFRYYDHEMGGFILTIIMKEGVYGLEYTWQQLETVVLLTYIGLYD